MKLKLLKNYKVIFVDFDNTICLHKYTINYNDVDSLFAENEFSSAEKFFKNSKINKLLRVILLNHKTSDNKFIVITDSGSKQLLAKEAYLVDKGLLYVKLSDTDLIHTKDNKDKPLFEDIISTSCDCSKEQYILSYMKHHGLRKQDVCLIDDNPLTVNAINRNKSFPTYTVQYIINQYFSKAKKKTRKETEKISKNKE